MSFCGGGVELGGVVFFPVGALSSGGKENSLGMGG